MSVTERLLDNIRSLLIEIRNYLPTLKPKEVKPEKKEPEKTAEYNATRRVMVSTQAAELVGSNPKRVGVLIINNGTDTIYILAKESLKKEQGIPLPHGTEFEDTVSTGAWYGIAESGTQDIRIATVGK